MVCKSHSFNFIKEMKMKKLVIAAAAVLSLSAFAADLSVDQVRDYSVAKDGIRVGTQVVGVSVAATHIGDEYNRVSVGKDFELAKLGPVALSAGGAAVYQKTQVAGVDNGFGLTVGAKATYAVTKSVDAVVGTEKFYGQNRIGGFNGNTGMIGVSVKF